MEITKLQDKPLSALEKARQEFAEFNRKALSAPKAPSVQSTKIAAPEQVHGDRILYCSQVPQASAALFFKLHGKEAEIIDVVVRRKAPVPLLGGGSQAVRSSVDTRALALGVYKGCPHCDNKSLVRCACGNLSCIASDAAMILCPVCGHRGTVVDTGIDLEFSGGKSGQKANPHADQKLLTTPTHRLALPSQSK